MIEVARHRWRILTAVLGCATIALTWWNAHPNREIVADPSTFAPPTVATVEVPRDIETHPEHAGVVFSPVTSDPLLRPRVKRQAPPRLDSVDPWTGEDLAPQLELAAIARTRLEIDRVDVWDPSVRYDSSPGQEDPRLDATDPWTATASLERDRAPVGGKLARRHLADEDPWAATPTGRSAKGGDPAMARSGRL